MHDPQFAHLSAKEALNAGYFPDLLTATQRNALNEAQRVGVMLTPDLETQLRAHPTSETVVIPVLPGAMNPPHAGHLLSLEVAAAALRQKGYRTLSGVLAPDHDAYIQRKAARQGVPALNMNERFELTRQLGAASGVLASRAAMAWGSDVNYSDVLRAVQAEARLTHPRAVTALVCGSDNQNFAQAFTEQGLIVVIRRAGIPITVPETPHVITTEPEGGDNHPAAGLSSTHYWRTHEH